MFFLSLFVTPKEIELIRASEFGVLTFFKSSDKTHMSESSTARLGDKAGITRAGNEVREVLKHLLDAHAAQGAKLDAAIKKHGTFLSAAANDASFLLEHAQFRLRGPLLRLLSKTEAFFRHVTDYTGDGQLMATRLEVAHKLHGFLAAIWQERQAFNKTVAEIRDCELESAAELPWSESLIAVVFVFGPGGCTAAEDSAAFVAKQRILQGIFKQAVALIEGQQVELCNLKKNLEYNGRHGCVVDARVTEGDGKVVVLLAGSSTRTKIAAANIVLRH
jgi:hypothetical protein